MPTYDYKCSECGHVFEEFQPISAPPLTKCPSCGKEGLRRILGGGAGMIFKGQGFYLTDYKNTGGKKPTESPKAEGSKTPKPTEATPKTTTSTEK